MNESRLISVCSVCIALDRCDIAVYTISFNLLLATTLNQFEEKDEFEIAGVSVFRSSPS